MGQIATAVAMIIDAIGKVNKSIQESTGYIEQHIIILGQAAAIQIVGVAGAIAGLPVATKLRGAIAAACTTAAAMADIIKGLKSSADGVSDLTSSELVNINKLISSSAALVTLEGVFSDATILMAASETIASEVIAAPLVVATQLVGTSDGTVTGVAAKLWV